jgi:hypothetical protein
MEIAVAGVQKQRAMTLRTKPARTARQHIAHKDSGRRR